MNYIILDFEWDGAYYPKIGGFINQILQIGAVKLNERFDTVDTFDVTVRSSFTKRVSRRFTELTGITKADMLAGIPLEEAFCRYNDWCGSDSITMTWSNSDIYTILENEKKLLDGTKLKIEKYLDLQQFIQGEMRIKGIEVNSQISLANAAAVFGIEVDEESLHNAKADSIICAKLLKKCYNAERFSALIADASDPRFFVRYSFKPYTIKNIDDDNLDKSLLVFNCPDCNIPLTLSRKWHYHSGTFFADLVCDNCDKKFTARLRAKKYYDSVKVHRSIRIKTPPKEDDDDLQDMSEKV